MTHDPAGSTLGCGFLSGLAASSLLGAIWGACETTIRILVYTLGSVHGMLEVPKFSTLDGVEAICLSAFEYGLFGAFLGALAFLVLPPLLSAVRPARDRAWATFVSPRFTVLFTALFLNFFWWSRFSSRMLGLDFLQFAYSEPFHSPKRLFLSGVFALASALLAGLITVWISNHRKFMARAARIAIIIVTIAATGFFLRQKSIAGDRPSADAAGGDHNIVLVIVDTLRAFNMHAYGYDRENTPRLDELAKEGVLFERAVVQAPYTWTSFGSIFTGKYPRNHGLVKMDHTTRFNPKKNITLQSTLDSEGFRTGAFMTGMLSNASGLLDGFQTYYEAMVGREAVHRNSVWTYFRSELVLHSFRSKIQQAIDPRMVSRTAIDWVKDNADGRFLAVVHLYSTHTPYAPPRDFDVYSDGYSGPIEVFTTQMASLLEQGQAQISPEDRQRIVDLYDSGVLFADAMIGEIVDELDALGILDNTIVVVTSDHGEELGERGLWEHDWMFNTNQLVPLIMRMPNRTGAGIRVSTPVELIDLFPTLLELEGINTPEGVDGESLVPWIRGDRLRDNDYAFCENKFYISVQNNAWKLVRNRFGDPKDPPRLYHIASDPLELRPVPEEKSQDVRAELAAQLDAYDESMPTYGEARGPGSKVNERLLRELGYLGGGSRPVEGRHIREREDPTEDDG